MKTTSTLQQKLTVSFRLFLKFVHKILLFFGIKDFAKWALPHAVCIYLADRDGKVLAVSRKDDLTKFGLPGGKVDPEELDEQAAIRELYEETGIQVSVFSLRKVFEDTDDFEYWTTCYYACVVSVPQIIEQIPGEGQVKWVNRDVLTSGIFAEYNTKAFKAIDEQVTKRCLACGVHRGHKNL